MKSEKYDMVKHWWEVMHNKKMIENAVNKGFITEEEYEEIIAL